MWERRSALAEVIPPRDGAAFGAELNKALPRLRRRALAITGQWSLADDLVQDCLERAWRARDSLTSATMPFSWLCTILRHAHIDGLRRHKHERQSVEIDEVAETLAILPEMTDETMDLMEAMKALNTNQRSILLLAGVEGLSYQEIAQELDVPLGTVMSRLARARQTLRALLDAGSARSSPTPAGASPRAPSRAPPRALR